MSENDAGGPMDANLNEAGQVIDKAIDYMLGKEISALAIASALLGGSIGLLARTMNDEAIAQVLSNALESVRAGELEALRNAPPRS